MSLDQITNWPQAFSVVGVAFCIMVVLLAAWVQFR